MSRKQCKQCFHNTGSETQLHLCNSSWNRMGCNVNTVHGAGCYGGPGRSCLLPQEQSELELRAGVFWNMSLFFYSLFQNGAYMYNVVFDLFILLFYQCVFNKEQAVNVLRL